MLVRLNCQVSPLKLSFLSEEAMKAKHTQSPLWGSCSLPVTHSSVPQATFSRVREERRLFLTSSWTELGGLEQSFESPFIYQSPFSKESWKLCSRALSLFLQLALLTTLWTHLLSYCKTVSGLSPWFHRLAVPKEPAEMFAWRLPSYLWLRAAAPGLCQPVGGDSPVVSPRGCLRAGEVAKREEAGGLWACLLLPFCNSDSGSM